jgi:hypothetical protein
LRELFPWRGTLSLRLWTPPATRLIEAHWL